MPFENIVVAITFGVVLVLAMLLFDRLSGSTPPESKAARVSWGQVGQAVSIAGLFAYFQDFQEGVGVALAVVCAVLVALLWTAWRQRFRENRVYRGALRQQDAPTKRADKVGVELWSQGD